MSNSRDWGAEMREELQRFVPIEGMPRLPEVIVEMAKLLPKRVWSTIGHGIFPSGQKYSYWTAIGGIPWDSFPRGVSHVVLVICTEENGFTYISVHGLEGVRGAMRHVRKVVMRKNPTDKTLLDQLEALQAVFRILKVAGSYRL